MKIRNYVFKNIYKSNKPKIEDSKKVKERSRKFDSRVQLYK